MSHQRWGEELDARMLDAGGRFRRRKPAAGEVEVKQLSKKELAKRRAAVRREAKMRGVKVTFGQAA